MTSPTLVFDLDGTLIDTAPDLIASTNHALADLGLDPLPADVLRPAIGFGARAMIVTGLKQCGWRLDEPEIDRLLERFLVYYEANIAAVSRPFPGAIEALAGFRAAGHPIAICTNKREGLSRQLVEALRIAHLFDAIAGRDTFPVHKPDAGHLTGAVRMAGGDPARAIMIGDTIVDIATARAAGVPVIACAFGYSDVPLATLAPDVIVAGFDEIGKAVEGLIAAGAAADRGH